MDDGTRDTLAGRSGGRSLGVVVLAAGQGRRFGGHKLRALLEGRPILQHVLDRVASVDPVCTVVVLGPAPGPLDEDIRWGAQVRVRNPRPEDGLSSSLRLGVAALPGHVEGVFVVLGDQPRLRAEVLLALAAAVPGAVASGAWAVVPDYADDASINPALLLPPAIEAVEHLTGDTGLGGWLRGEPTRSWRVAVAGSNPDVDTPADLAALTGTS